MKQDHEIKSEMITKMGHDLGSLFYLLYNETVWLTMKWVEYKELYGTKKSRIDLMNKTAPLFFYIVEKTLWKDLMLGITRLTDPEKSMGKKNLTLQLLPKHISDNELKKIIEADNDELTHLTDFCRDWRNRSIAHNDYDLFLNETIAIPLKSANRKKLQEVFDKLHAIIKKVYLHYLGRTIMLEYIDSFNGAQALLVHLENGLRFEELRYKRKLSGTWRNDDYESMV